MFLKAQSSFEQVYIESTLGHTCKYMHIFQEIQHVKCKIGCDSHYIYLRYRQIYMYYAYV